MGEIMVEYYLKTRDGMVLEHTRTTSQEKIGEEKLWYENRGYTVEVWIARPFHSGQGTL